MRMLRENWPAAIFALILGIAVGTLFCDKPAPKKQPNKPNSPPGVTQSA